MAREVFPENKGSYKTIAAPTANKNDAAQIM